MDNDELCTNINPDDLPVVIDDFISLGDRVDIFRHLTVDQATSAVNYSIFSGLLSEYYHEFIDFCNRIQSEDQSKIKDVSCHIADNTIYFDVTYREGEG